MSDVQTPYGPISAEAFRRVFPDPRIWNQEWDWARPFASILRLGGWSIDALINDPSIAGAVRQLWHVWKVAERVRQEQERARDLEFSVLQSIWWREMGCPVACMLCGRMEACDCARTSEHALAYRRERQRERDELKGGGMSWD